MGRTTDSNNKNLRTLFELLKPPDTSFASIVINSGVENVHKKILCKLSRLRHHISFFRGIVLVPTPHRCIVAKLYQTSSDNLVYNYQSYQQ